MAAHGKNVAIALEISAGNPVNREAGGGSRGNAAEFLSRRIKQSSKMTEYPAGQLNDSSLSLETQIVSSAIDGDQFVLCRNQGQGFLDLLDAAEWIARALHEKARRAKIRQMLNA